MSLRTIFSPPGHSPYADAALLLVRLVAGAAFMTHGWSKIQNPFGWMGADAFAPPFFQALAALSEFAGGLAWILGLLTPLAASGIACTMTVAIWTLTFKYAAPFVASTMAPASELPAVYFCVALVLITVGPGRLSLDRAIFGRR